MPLVEPNKLREKELVVAPAKTGKTSCWLSIAYWAKKSNDTRTFFVLDTDEAVLAVMDEPKYDGLIRSVDGEVVDEGGNIVLFHATEWPDYQDFTSYVRANYKQGDWCVIDMVSHAWSSVQDFYLKEIVGKSRGTALMDAARTGATGWDLFREADMNWTVINGLYNDFLTPLNVKSPGLHLFWAAEMETLDAKAKKQTEEQKAFIQEFGIYKPVGQKRLAYQCRSFLRVQRLARGRVLFTEGDRARQTLQGDDMAPDFFTSYLRKVAGWTITDGTEAAE